MSSYARKAQKKDVKIPRCCGKRMNKKKLGNTYLLSCPTCGKMGTINNEGKFVPFKKNDEGVTNEEE